MTTFWDHVLGDGPAGEDEIGYALDLICATEDDDDRLGLIGDLEEEFGVPNFGGKLVREFWDDVRADDARAVRLYGSNLGLQPMPRAGAGRAQSVILPRDSYVLLSKDEKSLCVWTTNRNYTGVRQGAKMIALLIDAAVDDTTAYCMFHEACDAMRELESHINHMFTFMRAWMNWKHFRSYGFGIGKERPFPLAEIEFEPLIISYYRHDFNWFAFHSQADIEETNEQEKS